MRLTLRTLLAYLDGILEPKDAEDLGKKVEESEYATGLVHRVRDVMRRLRLGAPSLTDRGPGLDPNTVAEYLDNTLATDRVTDFEKVCLDSDTHLAEVAASHQILTLVLGEPAEIDEATRQRMYEVQDVHGGAKSAPPPPPPVGSAAPTTADDAPSLSLDLDLGDRKPRTKPTVPEYLREPRRRRAWMTTIGGTVAAVCVLVLVCWLFGLFEAGTPMGNVLVSWGVIAPAPSTEVAVNGGKTDGKAREKDDGTTETKQVTPENETPDTKQGPTAKSGTEPAGESGKKTATPPVAPVAGTASGAVLPPKPAGGTTTEPKVTLPVAPNPPPKPVVVEPPKPATDTVKEPLPPDEPEPLGRFLSSDQVLLSDNPPNGWTRVAANQTLIPQDVLALPTYRPTVVLTAGVALDIIGGSRVKLLGSNAKELPGIRIVFGRVVLMSQGKGDVRMRVEFGEHHGTITFVDAKSVAALDVRNRHVAGTNPEGDSPHVMADLFVSGGEIAWDDTVDGKAEKQQRLAPSERLAFDGQALGTLIAGKELPIWIAADAAVRAPMSPREQLERSKASPAIAQALPTDQPARLKLLELLTSRPQWEVRWLSLRCLGYVGQFREIVVALNDPAQKPHWRDYADALRAAVDRDPESAAAVRVALEKQFPKDAADLYRMLWGYNDKQLESGDDGKGGEDAKLVQGLRNDDVLAVRRLSYWNLQDITGQGGLYQPEDSHAKRMQGVRRWDQRLTAKEIRFAGGERKARGPVHENVTLPAPKRGR
jgi:hypothetical protein